MKQQQDGTPHFSRRDFLASAAIGGGLLALSSGCRVVRTNAEEGDPNYTFKVAKFRGSPDGFDREFWG
ncbi:MAG: twin-arginine translocation signal domain-containing protein, partial [Gemmataceae bacterium]